MTLVSTKIFTVITVVFSFGSKSQNLNYGGLVYKICLKSHQNRTVSTRARAARTPVCRLAISSGVQ